MGATIDDEVMSHPNSYLWLPYSHAAGYAAHDRIDFVAVSDAVEEKAREIQARYEVANFYTDYRDMITAEKPDIVSIATRPATHRDMVVFAAENGVKGIYCEKSLCGSMDEADAMLAACEANGVKFNYGTQRRYTPLYNKMRELVDTGELGSIQTVIGHCGVSAAQWGHTHTTDMLLYLAGDPEVEYVQGSAILSDEERESQHIDSDPGIPTGYVKFANGVHGHMVASGGHEYEVSGSKGKLRSHNNGVQCLWRKSVGSHGQFEDVPFPTPPHSSGTLGAITDMVEAIEEGRETLGNIRVACRSQEMILGLIESERQGGARVPLPMENRSLYVGKSDW
jgi:predicted dehydrogenase